MKPLLSVLFSVILLFFEGPAFAAESSGILETRDLQATGREAAELGGPVVLLVSQEHCPYCVRIREEIIEPLIKSQDFAGQVLFRELFMDAWVQVRDFDGVLRGGVEVAHEYGVDLTPTILFLSPQGEELTKRLVGMRTPEMMFAYLEAHIRSALAVD